MASNKRIKVEIERIGLMAAYWAEYKQRKQYKIMPQCAYAIVYVDPPPPPPWMPTPDERESLIEGMMEHLRKDISAWFGSGSSRWAYPTNKATADEAARLYFGPLID